MFRFAAFTAAVCFVVSGPASATDFWQGTRGYSGYEPGQVYGGPGVGGGVYHLPDFSIFTVGEDDFPPLNRHLEYQPQVTAGGPGGTIGYVLPDDTLPDWLGEKTRVELSGAYWSGGGRDHDDRPFPVDFAVSPIDGSAVTSFGVTSGFNSTLDVDYDAFEVGLRVASDFALASNLYLTPSVGVFGGRSTEEYFLFYRQAPSQATSSGGSVNERNSSSRFGGGLGLDVTYHPVEFLTLFLGGRAEGYHIRTDLRGRDCRNTTLATGADCEVTPGPTWQTTVSDDGSTAGFRGKLVGGVGVNMGAFMISFGGFATYETAVPGVDNPTRQWTPAGGGFALTPNRPAKLTYDEGHSYGGFINFVVPFYRPN